jgi:hypothetical protein
MIFGGAYSISVLLYCIKGEKSTSKMNKYRENVYLFFGRGKLGCGEFDVFQIAVYRGGNYCPS